MNCPPESRRFPRPASISVGVFRPETDSAAIQTAVAADIFVARIGLCRAFSALLLCQVASAGQDSKSAFENKPPSSGPIQWNFSVGAGYRHLGNVDFDSGAFSHAGLLPTLQPVLGTGLPSSVQELGIGGPASFGNRSYRDGFVFVDGATADPSSFLPGTTGYWGYQSDSQVRNGSLYFSGGEYATSTSNGSSSVTPSDWSSGVSGASPVIELEGILPINRNWSLGGMASFLMINAESSHSSTSFRAFRSLSESTYSVTDRYDLQGVIPPLAPYEGLLDPLGPQPLIDNIPTERIVTQTGDSFQSATFFNEVSESIKIRLYTLSLGPTVHYDSDRFIFSGGMGLAVNVANWDATFGEQLNQESGGSTTELRKWRARNGKTELLPGLYLQGTAGYRIADDWVLSVFGRYDWSDSLSGNVGPSSFSADLSGYTLGGSVTFTF